MASDLGEFNITFNGWSTTCDGPTQLSGDLDGIRSRSGVGTRSGDVERGRGHGSVPGPMFAADRIITAGVRVRGDADVIEAEVSAMEAAFTIRSDELPLTWTIRDVTRQSNVRVRNVDLPVTREYALGVARVTVQFVATDPNIYAAGIADGLTDTGLHTVQTSAGSVTGGLGFPHGFPHGFGTATTGVVSVRNNGSAPAPWTATLKGPLSGPRIDLVSTTGVLELSGFDLLDGDTLEFDSKNRTVLLNGTASRYGSLSQAEWFDLPTGPAQVQLTTATGGSHSDALTLQYRDTFL